MLAARIRAIHLVLDEGAQLVRRVADDLGALFGEARARSSRSTATESRCSVAMTASGKRAGAGAPNQVPVRKSRPSGRNVDTSGKSSAALGREWMARGRPAWIMPSTGTTLGE
jgi:hypothetical protein